MSFYKVIDLGPVQPVSATAHGLNDNNTIVGEMWNPDGPPVRPAFRYKDGVLSPLPSLPETTPATAYAVNNNTDVELIVGVVSDVPDKGILWKNQTTFTDLNYALGTDISIAYDVNDAGKVVGLGNYLAFVYDVNSGHVDFLTPGGSQFCSADAVNQQGDVVGTAYFGKTASEPFGFPRVFLQQAGGSPEFLAISDSHALATDINDAGAIAGYSYSDKKPPTHAFAYTAQKGLTDLGHLGGGSSVAYAINNNGTVVGESTTLEGDTRAFVYDSTTGMADLNDWILPYSDWILLRAYDINNNGAIVGGGLRSGVHRAFLLRPQSQSEFLGALAQSFMPVVVQILFGPDVGIVVGEGGQLKKIFPKGPPVDPLGPFRRLHPSERDILVGLALNVLARSMGSAEARRNVQAAVLGAIRDAVENLLIIGRPPGDVP